MCEDESSWLVGTTTSGDLVDLELAEDTSDPAQVMRGMQEIIEAQG